MNHIEVGNRGEEAAATYLEEAGYEILARKYRTKTGEVDIIAKSNNTMVFVEVKTRRSNSCGFPAESVTYRKQQKIMNTAMCYLYYIGQKDQECRFDVMEVFLTDHNGVTYNHIMDAFQK